MTKYLEEAEILENKEISKDNFLLILKSNNLLEKLVIPKAGQFYMIKGKDNANILRRPISLHSYDEQTGELQFYYKVVGVGTKDFTRFEKGEKIDIQGPLGNGFTTDYKNKKIVVIGGGIGLAPFKQLINEMQNDNEIIFIGGARNREEIKIIDNFGIVESDNIKVKLCTDDGSVGQKGFTTNILEEYMINKENNIDIIFACGPHAMLEAVGAIANNNKIKCELSLEERMACGVRACVGCSIKTLSGMKKVCHDGPIFDSTVIIQDNNIEVLEQGGCGCD